MNIDQFDFPEWISEEVVKAIKDAVLEYESNDDNEHGFAGEKALNEDARQR